jgi:hypothetical protein
MIFNLLFGLMNDFGAFVHLYHHVVKVLHQIQVPHGIFCLCKIVKHGEIFLDKRNVLLQDSCFVKKKLLKKEQFLVIFNTFLFLDVKGSQIIEGFIFWGQVLRVG